MFFFKGGCYGNTADVSHNTFSGYKSPVKGGPKDGNRIDYIFYRCNGDGVKCVECEVTMRLVPGKQFSFSDHEGVSAEFAVKNLHEISRTGKSQSKEICLV